MANVLASDLVKRKKEHVFVEGYQIDCATELTGGVDATSDVMHVYGQDDAIKDVTVNTGTLSLTVYDKKSNNKLLDALQEIDPDDTAVKVYNWNNINSTSVWANRFNADNTQYTRSIFYGRWLPTPGMTAGDTNAKGTRTFAGNCDVPKEYSQPIFGEKLKLTTGATGTAWSATLTRTPVQCNPGQTPALYAIRVVAIQEERSGTSIKSIEQEDLTITSSMVTSGKAVSINGANDLSVNSWATHVYVNYLYDKTLGVYPTVAPVGMYKLVTT